MKIDKTEEVKNSYLLRDFMNLMKFLGKNITWWILKVTLISLQAIYFLKYVLSVKVWIFLNETSTSVFAELAIFHSI